MEQTTNYLYFCIFLATMALVAFRRSFIVRALWATVERCYWVFILFVFLRLQIQEYYSNLIHGFRLTKDKRCYYAKDYYIYDEETNELRLKNDFDFVKYSELKRDYNTAINGKNEIQQLASAKALLQKYISRYPNAGADNHTFTSIKNLDVLQWTKFSQINKSSSSKSLVEKEFDYEPLVDKSLSFRNQVCQRMRILVGNNKETVVCCFNSPIPVDYFVNSPEVIILRVMEAKYAMIQASIIMNWIYRDFSRSLGYSESNKSLKTPVDVIYDIEKHVGRRSSIDIFECYRPCQ